MNSVNAPRPEKRRVSDAAGISLGVLGLVTFPLAGAALVARLVDPLTFVALSLTALAVFGAAMMRLHRV